MITGQGQFFLTGIRRIDHVLSTGMAGVATMTVTAKTTFMTATGHRLGWESQRRRFRAGKPAARHSGRPASKNRNSS